MNTSFAKHRSEMTSRDAGLTGNGALTPPPQLGRRIMWADAAGSELAKVNFVSPLPASAYLISPSPQKSSWLSSSPGTPDSDMDTSGVSLHEPTLGGTNLFGATLKFNRFMSGETQNTNASDGYDFGDELEGAASREPEGIDVLLASMGAPQEVIDTVRQIGSDAHASPVDGSATATTDMPVNQSIVSLLGGSQRTFAPIPASRAAPGPVGKPTGRGVSVSVLGGTVRNGSVSDLSTTFNGSRQGPVKAVRLDATVQLKPAPVTAPAPRVSQPAQPSLPSALQRTARPVSPAMRYGGKVLGSTWTTGTPAAAGPANAAMRPSPAAARQAAPFTSAVAAARSSSSSYPAVTVSAEEAASVLLGSSMTRGLQQQAAAELLGSSLRLSTSSGPNSVSAAASASPALAATVRRPGSAPAGLGRGSGATRATTAAVGAAPPASASLSSSLRSGAAANVISVPAAQSTPQRRQLSIVDTARPPSRGYASRAPRLPTATAAAALSGWSASAVGLGSAASTPSSVGSRQGSMSRTHRTPSPSAAGGAGSAADNNRRARAGDTPVSLGATFKRSSSWSGTGVSRLREALSATAPAMPILPPTPVPSSSSKAGGARTGSAAGAGQAAVSSLQVDRAAAVTRRSVVDSSVQADIAATPESPDGPSRSPPTTAAATAARPASAEHATQTVQLANAAVETDEASVAPALASATSELVREAVQRLAAGVSPADERTVSPVPSPARQKPVSADGDGTEAGDVVLQTAVRESAEPMGHTLADAGPVAGVQRSAVAAAVRLPAEGVRASAGLDQVPSPAKAPTAAAVNVSAPAVSHTSSVAAVTVSGALTGSAKPAHGPGRQPGRASAGVVSDAVAVPGQASSVAAGRDRGPSSVKASGTTKGHVAPPLARSATWSPRGRSFPSAGGPVLVTANDANAGQSAVDTSALSSLGSVTHHLSFSSDVDGAGAGLGEMAQTAGDRRHGTTGATAGHANDIRSDSPDALSTLAFNEAASIGTAFARAVAAALAERGLALPDASLAAGVANQSVTMASLLAAGVTGLDTSGTRSAGIPSSPRTTRAGGTPGAVASPYGAFPRVEESALGAGQRLDVADGLQQAWINADMAMGPSAYADTTRLSAAWSGAAGLPTSSAASDRGAAKTTPSKGRSKIGQALASALPTFPGPSVPVSRLVPGSLPVQMVDLLPLVATPLDVSTATALVASLPDGASHGQEEAGSEVKAGAAPVRPLPSLGAVAGAMRDPLYAPEMVLRPPHSHSSSMLSADGNTTVAGPHAGEVQQLLYGPRADLPGAIRGFLSARSPKPGEAGALALSQSGRVDGSGAAVQGGLLAVPLSPQRAATGGAAETLLVGATPLLRGEAGASVYAVRPAVRPLPGSSRPLDAASPPPVPAPVPEPIVPVRAAVSRGFLSYTEVDEEDEAVAEPEPAPRSPSPTQAACLHDYTASVVDYPDIPDHGIPAPPVIAPSETLGDEEAAKRAREALEAQLTRSRANMTASPTRIPSPEKVNSPGSTLLAGLAGAAGGAAAAPLPPGSPDVELFRRARTAMATAGATAAQMGTAAAKPQPTPGPSAGYKAAGGPSAVKTGRITSVGSEGDLLSASLRSGSASRPLSRSGLSRTGTSAGAPGPGPVKAAAGKAPSKPASVTKPTTVTPAPSDSGARPSSKDKCWDRPWAVRPSSATPTPQGGPTATKAAAATAAAPSAASSKPQAGMTATITGTAVATAGSRPPSRTDSSRPVATQTAGSRTASRSPQRSSTAAAAQPPLKHAASAPSMSGQAGARPSSRGPSPLGRTRSPSPAPMAGTSATAAAAAAKADRGRSVSPSAHVRPVPSMPTVSAGGTGLGHGAVEDTSSLTPRRMLRAAIASPPSPPKADSLEASIIQSKDRYGVPRSASPERGSSRAVSGGQTAQVNVSTVVDMAAADRENLTRQRELQGFKPAPQPVAAAVRPASGSGRGMDAYRPSTGGGPVPVRALAAVGSMARPISQAPSTASTPARVQPAVAPAAPTGTPRNSTTGTRVPVSLPAASAVQVEIRDGRAYALVPLDAVTPRLGHGDRRRSPSPAGAVDSSGTPVVERMRPFVGPNGVVAPLSTAVTRPAAVVTPRQASQGALSASAFKSTTGIRPPATPAMADRLQGSLRAAASPYPPMTMTQGTPLLARSGGLPPARSTPSASQRTPAAHAAVDAAAALRRLERAMETPTALQAPVGLSGSGVPISSSGRDALRSASGRRGSGASVSSLSSTDTPGPKAGPGFPPASPTTKLVSRLLSALAASPAVGPAGQGSKASSTRR